MTAADSAEAAEAVGDLEAAAELEQVREWQVEARAMAAAAQGSADTRPYLVAMAAA